MSRPPISYLDQEAELPVDRLELFFILKRAISHLVLIAYETVKSKEGVRDSALILARCARRLAIVAQALADADPVVSPVRVENAELNRKEMSA